MRNNPGQVLAIVLAGTVIIVIGMLISVYVGRKARNANDWLAAPESLPLGVVVVTQFAAAAGGGVMVAEVGIAYTYGLSVFFYDAATLLGFLLLALIAKWLRQQRFTTVPDIVSKLFGQHRAVTTIAGIAALIVPFGWVCTQFVAFAKLFGLLTGLPVALLVGLILVGSVAFVLPGGLTSVAWTDFVFGIFKITMALVIAGYAVWLAGGFSGIGAKVPSDLTGPASIATAGGEHIWLWIASIVPGTLTNQLYYQRVFATKRLSHARRGLVLSGFVLLIAGVYASCIGLSVRAMRPGLPGESAAGWLLTRLPTALLVLFGAFIVAMIVSTSGAALQSVVANLVRDLDQNLLGRNRTDRATVRLSRIMTIIVALIAGGLAVSFPSALDWLVASYAYSAAALAAPIFGGYLLRKRITLRPSSALAAMLSGIIGCASAQLAETAVPFAVYGIITSAIVLSIFAIRDRSQTPNRHAAPTTPTPVPKE